MSEAALSQPKNPSADHHRLCLVSMPFSSLQHPGLGLALLAQLARRAGASTTEKFFSFDFAEAIGLDRYSLLSDGRFYQALLGEWVFSDLIYPRNEAVAFEYLTTVLADHVSGVEWLTVMQDAISARKATKDFVDQCAEDVLRDNPTVVGITSSFQQVMSSLAIAKALRQRSDDVVIVMGGANCEGPLGQTLLKAHPELDAVCIGEGDDAFPEFLSKLQSRHDLPETPGILTQTHKTRSLEDAKAPLVTDLDALPVPDFSSFFDRFHNTPGLLDLFPPSATIETSRGCWWGAKHHCTFCGLNGQSMTYRSKSPERAFAEFSELADLYGPDLVVVDNILDHRYLRTLIPKLAQDERPFLMHYEVKSNLSPTVIASLANGGVRKVQPGIETFDTKTLAHMRKGVSGIQNIQTLKLCAEAGVFVEWCFLYGFPGEDPEGFHHMAKLIPQLHHLQAPGSIGPVRADRFSPYFDYPEAYGIQVRPAKPYGYIFDVANEDLAQYAYHFDIVDGDQSAAHDRAAPTLDALAIWQNDVNAAELYLDGGVVVDTRDPDQPLKHELSAVEIAVLEQTPTIAGRTQLEDRLKPAFGRDAVRDAIQRLLHLNLLYSEEDAVLSLVLRTPGFTRAPEWSVIRSHPELAFSVQRSDAFC
ncbi:RiPP maturation radical SAM C-methyltransferase [Ruegeria sp. R14_0]|uniref:RiPP maturation radical SAM C-methyltransferase n=1 Tax=Ruegeria sp. R14_0 TaxID=2821100 RepID=UPI001ADD17A8|nr:RiPP maturation radical SAM C-methyltransferase [Ruegeria sp. R14_0]MBO9446756.1 RiPP maturation radical SAM C-methyltransferase [Ruegeria sp. R14_0]